MIYFYFTLDEELFGITNVLSIILQLRDQNIVQATSLLIQPKDFARFEREWVESIHGTS